MTEPRVIGLDLSLSSTGIALPDGTTVIKGYSLPKDATDAERCERIDFIRRAVITYAINNCTGPALLTRPLVVVEGFSFGSPQGATEAGGLGWAVRIALHLNSVPFAVVPPSSLKKYATGKGNAGKEEMLAAAIRRLGYDGHDNNEADALWLRAMALDALGCPLVEMPAVNRGALEKVEWPS